MCRCVDCVSCVSVSSASLKGSSQERKGQKGTGGGRTGYGKREVVTTLSPPPPSSLKTVATILLNFIWLASSPSKLETMPVMFKNCTEKFQN